MAGLAQAVRALGGIAATHELLQLGYTPGLLQFASQRGEIFRPRKGWYANADLSPEIIRAWRVGGRLACASAAVEFGLWTPDFDGLHVEVKHEAARLRSPADRRTRLSSVDDSTAVVHWCTVASPGSRTSVSVAACIRQVFSCLGSEAGFVVLESALRRGRLDEIDRHELTQSLPQRFRSVAGRANHLSDSGSESEMKLILHDLSIPFRQQVLVAEKWPVDFLIGEYLAIEADSKAHHSDPYRDRRKDAELSEASVRVLRFMYSQIHFERPAVARAIVAAVARGDASSA
jgi:very-short-patch-repair endonuclease